MLVDLIEQSKRLRPETRRLYASAVKLYVTFCGGEHHALVANANTVERWRDVQIEDGITPAAVNVRLFALRFLGRRLADRGENDNLLRAARATELLATSASKKSCPLTLETARQLVASCVGDRLVDARDHAIATLALRTGLRRAGIAAVELADYDPPRLTVILKGGRRHVLPDLDGETIGLLNSWRDVLAMRRITTGKMFRSIRAQPDLHGQPVIGERLTGQSVYRTIRERGEAVGLKLGAHDCRRYFVSAARHAGWPDWYIALWTGHRSGGIARVGVSMLDLYTSPIEGPRTTLPSFQLASPGPSFPEM